MSHRMNLKICVIRFKKRSAKNHNAFRISKPFIPALEFPAGVVCLSPKQFKTIYIAI